MTGSSYTRTDLPAGFITRGLTAVGLGFDSFIDADDITKLSKVKSNCKHETGRSSTARSIQLATRTMHGNDTT